LTQYTGVPAACQIRIDAVFFSSSCPGEKHFFYFSLQKTRLVIELTAKQTVAPAAVLATAIMYSQLTAAIFTGGYDRRRWFSVR